MRILVIHPKDATTDFLSVIYTGKGWTVINFNTSKKFLKEQIKAHDRVVMLGHGTQYGLLGYGRLVIDSSWVFLLREKQCVCIWCNADLFVTKYGLQGFYTGMIISETQEAEDYSVLATENEIAESNFLFADSVRLSIDAPDVLGKMIELYSGDTAVMQFNGKNLYCAANI